MNTVVGAGQQYRGLKLKMCFLLEAPIHQNEELNQN